MKLFKYSIEFIWINDDICYRDKSLDAAWVKCHFWEFNVLSTIVDYLYFLELEFIFIYFDS
jgi:hypothetical protein